MSTKAAKTETEIEPEPEATPKMRFRVTATVNEMVDIYATKYPVGVPVLVPAITGWMASQIQAKLMVGEEIK